MSISVFSDFSHVEWDFDQISYWKIIKIIINSNYIEENLNISDKWNDVSDYISSSSINDVNIVWNSLYTALERTIKYWT